MVYITADLFAEIGAAGIHSPADSIPIPNNGHLGKRKRTATADRQEAYSIHPLGNAALALYSSSKSAPQRPNSSRSEEMQWTASSPPAARLQSVIPVATFEHRPLKQYRRVHPAKSIWQPSTSRQLPLLATTQSAASDLRPCHVCRKAPTRRRDIEGYMDCQACDGRACLICARCCFGCARQFCRRCCDEVGEEGDPWCMACLAGKEGRTGCSTETI